MKVSLKIVAEAIWVTPSLIRSEVYDDGSISYADAHESDTFWMIHPPHEHSEKWTVIELLPDLTTDQPHDSLSAACQDIAERAVRLVLEDDLPVQVIPVEPPAAYLDGSYPSLYK